jgi:hypothetical protein
LYPEVALHGSSKLSGVGPESDWIDIVLFAFECGQPIGRAGGADDDPCRRYLLLLAVTEKKVSRSRRVDGAVLLFRCKIELKQLFGDPGTVSLLRYPDLKFAAILQNPSPKRCPIEIIDLDVLNSSHFEGRRRQLPDGFRGCRRSGALLAVIEMKIPEVAGEQFVEPVDLNHREICADGVREFDNRRR